ncbi:2-amino-4-hydroxy-6-hydroxymethyldihydropteridine diphosphokinase [Geitlerinema sp. PCC 9228]|jgi:2-amino-4-hydroxy-6-hydroxymethyldihydropteridine diphosphokinase|uniref:2-amino-4-hydroxy-6- hydroxymethyldihydropteridine diphosphokinase n=1 Tax=Geitlerinema sp. PCC 9228 TaxID=111611 RepID=UPI0008F9AAF0|nr:2-amino-4-hydroxy-6-hydroxymethyldihydropteridine diphosphokinase [Geitlerinema sp. PCC 9228]
MVSQAAIALGSNLGDSRRTLQEALEVCDRQPGISVVAASSQYRTAPVGPPQPDYANSCALLQVDRDSPEALLDWLLEVERRFGRVREQVWGPRTLDLDLLLFDERIVETSHLQLPHPRMAERAFVLVPLAEIAPHWIEPLSGRTIAELVAGIDTSGVRPFSAEVG